MTARADRIIAQTTELLRRGNSHDALVRLRAAVRKYSDRAELFARYGDACYLEGRHAEAKRAYSRAAALDGNLFQAWYGLGRVEFSGGAYASAEAKFRRARAIDPRDGEARLYLAKCFFYAGEVDRAIDELEPLAKRYGGALARKAALEVAKIVPGSSHCKNAQILQWRTRWAKWEAARNRPATRPKVRASASTKIRVGYVSAFFGSRNWMKPVWGPLNQHDRSAFDIHLIYDEQEPHADSGYRADSRDSAHDISGLSNREAAARIRGWGIDILVDLNAYSFPSRLGLFMRQPAPVQVGWFNSYATSGIRAFDAIIGDRIVIPPAEEKFYTERVSHVRGSYLAFEVLYPVPNVQVRPGASRRHLTFGCFAPQYKITDEVTATWAEILRKAPNARLILKNTFLDRAENRDVIAARFARLGVDPERVVLEPPAEHYEFLKAYARVDVGLDTFPYSGGSTTMEALWQGVPVLTFQGDRWVGRTTQSILETAGMKEWCVPSREEYVARGIALANSWVRSRVALKSLRKQMRGRLIDSAACDTARLCRDLEECYRKMTRRIAAVRRGNSPTLRPAGYGD